MASATNTVFRMKNHVQGRESVVAACDEELVGKSFKEGKLRLEVHSDFYDGMRADAQVLQSYLQRCTVANFVGERVVSLAISWGFVSPENVLRIDGVPHAQWALLI